VAANLRKDGIEANPDLDIIALIAYLQRLGTDIKQQPASQVGQAR
jgi:cytochrome c oxidase cbb3-type subunit I/II